jgi:small subunit ribosomal protein S9
MEGEELSTYTSETAVAAATHGQSDDGPGAGTGRRKEAIARVSSRPGLRVVTLNGRSLEYYFPKICTSSS